MLKFFHSLIGFLALPFYRHIVVERTNDSKYARFNETVTIELYKPTLGGEGKRLTLLHPILGDNNLFAKFLANYFAIFHQRPCAIVHRGQYPFNGEDPKEFNNYLEAYLYNYYLVEQALTDHGLLTDKTVVVSIGASMGGIVNSILSTYDHYDRYICIVAGAPIISIIRDSSLNRFDRWMMSQVRRHSMDVTDLHDWYLEDVKVEFMNWRRYAKPNKLKLITAWFDWVVPYEYQKRLAKASDASRTITLPGGHILALTLLVPFYLPVLSWWSLTTRKTKKDPFPYDRIYT